MTPSHPLPSEPDLAALAEALYTAGFPVPQRRMSAEWYRDMAYRLRQDLEARGYALAATNPSPEDARVPDNSPIRDYGPYPELSDGSHSPDRGFDGRLYHLTTHEYNTALKHAYEDGKTAVALSPAPAGLDAAWAEAEAALPGPDWLLEVVRRGAIAGDINPWTGYPVLAPTERYTASAGQAWNGGPSWKRLDPPQYEAEGPTPAAALHALAARLSPPVDRDAPREETA